MDVDPAAAETTPVLVMHVAGWRCALELSLVVETMRPLPLIPLPRAPQGVRGVSIVRGEPLPVVSLETLFGGTAANATESSSSSSSGRRYVVVRVGGRRVALEVDQVIGVRALAHQAFADAPRLVDAAVGNHVAAIGVVDGQLAAVLSLARTVPDEAFAAARALVSPHHEENS